MHPDIKLVERAKKVFSEIEGREANLLGLTLMQKEAKARSKYIDCVSYILDEFTSKMPSYILDEFTSKTLRNERTTAQSRMVLKNREYSDDVNAEAARFPIHKTVTGWAGKMKMTLTGGDVLALLKFKGSRNDATHGNFRWKNGILAR